MISKELLSEVLGYKISKAYIEDTQSVKYLNVFLDGDDTGIYDSINIHELAHKCKEWAYKQGFLLNSDSLGYCLHGCYEEDIIKVDQEWKSDTEPEAIFKACEWILENK